MIIMASLTNVTNSHNAWNLTPNIPVPISKKIPYMEGIRIFHVFVYHKNWFQTAKFYWSEICKLFHFCNTNPWCDTSPRMGHCHCLMPDYAHKCRTSTLKMVPINFWRNSDPFKKKEHFSSSKIDRVRAFLIKPSKFP